MTLPNGISTMIMGERVLRIDIPFGLRPIRPILLGSVNWLRAFVHGNTHIGVLSNFEMYFVRGVSSRELTYPA